MPRLASVLGLYALTVGLIMGLVGSVFVVPMVVVSPLGLVMGTGFLTMLVLPVIVLFYELFSEHESDPEPGIGRGWLLFVPLGLSVVAAIPAALVAGNEYAVRSGANWLLAPPHRLVASTFAVTVVVLIALPMVVNRRTWQRVDEGTDDGTSPDELSDEAEPLLAGVGDQFDVAFPDRLDVRWIDERAPAVYAFDDGRRAVLAFTTGALDVLSDREREAVVARELARVVERSAVPQFWANALALGVTDVVDLFATEPYAPRAGGKVRLPYWVVGPLKLIAAVIGLFVLFLVYAGTPLAYLPVSGMGLAVAYAIGVPLVAFALARAATRLARSVSTTHVLTADEHGAVLADDATALASALQTLHDANAEHNGPDDDETLGRLDHLTDCPTDRVPLQDRLDALDDVAVRLADRSGVDATTASASS